MRVTGSSGVVVRSFVSAIVAAFLLLGSGIGASAQGTGDAAQLSGRLGGTLDALQTRFGAPSWTDTNLIGYNSQTLAGVDTIVVAYYDSQNIVNKISLVYLEKPAQFTDANAIAGCRRRCCSTRWKLHSR